MTPEEAFFTVHRDLPREGPGSDADVLWAARLAGVARDARILDAGCGPGADVPALRSVAPDGRVVAVEAHAPFIDQARARVGDDPRVTLVAGDMESVEGPFDFVWSAGALYFLGIEPGLAVLGGKLAPGGAIAFSHLTYLVSEPDAELRAALVAELPDIDGPDALTARIRSAGFEMLGQRILPRASWEAYYGPLRERIAALRPEADPVLAAALDESEAEAALHDRFGDQYGYTLSVVRPA